MLTILSFLYSNSFSNDTLYAITSILRQLITNFSMHYFSLLSGDILQALIKTLTQCHQLCSQRIILLEVSYNIEIPSAIFN